MARRMWEPAAGGMLLLAALVVGLALPGNAATADIPQSVRDACGISGSRHAGLQMLHCAANDRQDFENNCCYFLTVLLSNKTDDCTCGGFKVIAERGIDVNKVCNTNAVTADKCRAKEAEAARQAREEEDLSKLEPCKSFFKRFAAGEVSMDSLKDAVACIQAMQKPPASCQEAARQEKEKMEELRKIEPCDKFFKRLFDGGVVSMDTLQDAADCVHAVKKRPASCQKRQY